MNILKDAHQQHDHEPGRSRHVDAQHPPAFARWFEVRRYRIGWVVRVGRVLLRWHSDANAKSLTLERIGRGNVLVGGRRL